jgi:dTDP-glucose pyrophosphorylase
MPADLKADVLNILVPMAGRGSRFARAGFVLPKPLLPAQGRPMIEVVIENIRPTRPHRFIFIAQQEHLDAHGLEPVLMRAGPGTRVIGIDGVTEGAACTTLLARELIDSAAPLMIANCDQYVATDIDDYLEAMDRSGLDGWIMTMGAHDPKWSFVRLDEQGLVCEVVEKRVVSQQATVGIYNFRRGSDYVRAADTMIAANDRTLGEFYVAPAYNHLLRAGGRVGCHDIGPDSAAMFGLGIPEDLALFNSLPGLPRPVEACA